jgi:hypothetical protein
VKLLPKTDWFIRRCGRDHIVAGIFEHPPGYIYKIKIALADLPNDLVSLNDLERFGIDPIHVSTVRKKILPNGGETRRTA